MAVVHEPYDNKIPAIPVMDVTRPVEGEVVPMGIASLPGGKADQQGSSSPIKQQ